MDMSGKDIIAIIGFVKKHGDLIPDVPLPPYRREGEQKYYYP